jgi:hypothetical protein
MKVSGRENRIWDFAVVKERACVPKCLAIVRNDLDRDMGRALVAIAMGLIGQEGGFLTTTHLLPQTDCGCRRLND